MKGIAFTVVLGIAALGLVSGVLMARQALASAQPERAVAYDRMWSVWQAIETGVQRILAESSLDVVNGTKYIELRETMPSNWSDSSNTRIQNWMRFLNASSGGGVEIGWNDSAGAGISPGRINYDSSSDRVEVVFENLSEVSTVTIFANVSTYSTITRYLRYSPPGPALRVNVTVRTRRDSFSSIWNARADRQSTISAGSFEITIGDSQSPGKIVYDNPYATTAALRTGFAFVNATPVASMHVPVSVRVPYNISKSAEEFEIS